MENIQLTNIECIRAEEYAMPVNSSNNIPPHQIISRVCTSSHHTSIIKNCGKLKTFPRFVIDLFRVKLIKDNSCWLYRKIIFSSSYL